MGSRRKQEDKHLQILRELVTLQHNKKCFDCGQRGPTYVNMTIGAFVCTSCSGLLRGLNPPHRIKSISMASFNSQEIEFLQKHGNEVCFGTWLALWESPLAPEPESRDEQKVKDFLARKYERKMWYSNRPKPKPNPQQEPEARPLKTLLGENAPQVIVASQQEQKSPRISPPQATLTAVQKPVQPVAAKQETKSNMDLLGDLGSDPFGSSAAPTRNNQDAFGMFQQPPPAQNQLFNVSQSASQAIPQSNSFDMFANAGHQQQQTSGVDFFASASTGGSVPFSSSNSGAVNMQTAADKYAAFSDMDLFKSSTTQSVFSGSSVFSNSPNTSVGMSSNTQPNPFMSPGTQSSGAAVFQQQQQQPVNPFQTAAQPQGGNPFPQQPNNQMNMFAMQNQPQSNSYAMSNGNMNFNSNQFQTANSNAFNASSNVSAKQQNLSFNGAAMTAMAANQFQMQPQNPSFGHMSNQSNMFPQSNFPLQQQNAFSNQQNFLQQQQQPAFSSTQYNQQQIFNRPQTSNNQFANQFSTNFSSQQSQANVPGGFPNQQSPGMTKPPFGGVQMPGLQQQQQQQQAFGSWGQTSQQQSRSTNPFM